jgi:hypothetical protein
MNTRESLVQEGMWIRGRLNDTDISHEYRYILGMLLRKVEAQLMEIEQMEAA